MITDVKEIIEATWYTIKYGIIDIIPYRIPYLIHSHNIEVDDYIFKYKGMVQKTLLDKSITDVNSTFDLYIQDNHKKYYHTIYDAVYDDLCKKDGSLYILTAGKYTMKKDKDECRIYITEKSFLRHLGGEE